jgi:hypothetical protein
MKKTHQDKKYLSPQNHKLTIKPNHIPKPLSSDIRKPFNFFFSQGLLHHQRPGLILNGPGMPLDQNLSLRISGLQELSVLTFDLEIEYLAQLPHIRTNKHSLILHTHFP